MSIPQAQTTRRRWIKWALVLVLLVALTVYTLNRTLSRGDAAAEVDRLVSSLELEPGMTVAEIGAGAGKMTVHMADRLGSTSRLYSTELNPERLDQIRDAIKEAGIEHVIVLEAGKAETNLPEDCCDAIFMSKVYHHFTDPETINRSLYESLRPGAALAVIDFEPSFWRFWMTQPHDVPEDRGGHGVPQALVAKELAATGFEIKEQIDAWWPMPFRRFCVVARRPVGSEQR